MENKFEKSTFSKRVKSMLSVDFCRAFTTPFFYILAGIALVMPVLILVMTTMMDGTVSVNPQTGVETVMEGFDNVWQIIGSLSTVEQRGAAGGGMDIASMCNINLVFFMTAVFACIFIADDFRSGYAKNLFAVRAKKSDYVFSKALVCFLGSGALLICFFIGALIGGAIANLPFAMEGFSVLNLVWCMLSKIFLMAVFTAIYVTMSVIGKQRTWLSILLSLGVGTLLFMMIPALTPLNANAVNALLCLAGGSLFGVGLGAVSKLLLDKIDLI